MHTADEDDLVTLPGTTTMSGATGKVVRGVRITGGPHETFGDSTVASATPARRAGTDSSPCSRSRASTPITAGGVKLSAASGTVDDQADERGRTDPGRQEARAHLGSTSLAQSPANPLYLAAVQPDAKITIGRVTLNLSVLKKAVSR